MNKKNLAGVLLISGILILAVLSGRILYVTRDYREQNRFQKEIRNYLEQQRLNGSVLLAKDGKIIYSDGAGYSDVERSQENTRDTTFKLASLTKQFTGNAVIVLEREGKLSTEDTIKKYFPDCSYGDRVTIRDLLEMKSGIPDYNGNAAFKAALGERFMYEGVDRQRLVKEILNQELLYEPGTVYDYSNSNYFLLGQIIEQVSEKPYERFIEETFLKPIGMRNAGFMGMIRSAEALDPFGKEDGVEFDGSVTYAAGGLCASVVDLYKWQKTLYGGRLGYDIREILGGQEGYAYGLEYKDGMYKHTGGLHICNTFLGYDEENDVQIIVLSNSSASKSPEVAEGLYEILIKHLRRTAWTEKK